MSAATATRQGARKPYAAPIAAQAPNAPAVQEPPDAPISAESFAQRAYYRASEACAVLNAAANELNSDAVWGLVTLLDAGVVLMIAASDDPTQDKCEDASGLISQVTELLALVCEHHNSQLLDACVSLLTTAQNLLVEEISTIAGGAR